jgi:hypothetical protein
MRGLYISLLATGLWIPGLGLASPVAEVIALRGSAAMVVDGRTSTVAIGTPVEQNSEIRTASPGRVKLRFIDGSVLIVSDGSTLKVDQFQIDKSDGARRASFSLDIGLISQKVVPSTGSWSVRTPSAVTAVRGTEYVIEVTPELNTEVNVKSGSVTVEPVSLGRKPRKRSIFDSAEASPVMLDRDNAGARCYASGECRNTDASSHDRLRELDDRLSGV